MAVMGMTGFGRADGVTNWGNWAWEVRSVNGKGLDVRLNTPQGMDALDFEARKLVKNAFARGNLQIQLQVEFDDSETGPVVDTALLGRLARRGRIMARVNGSDTPRFSDFLSVRGVVSMSGARSQLQLTEAMLKELLSGLSEALVSLQTARTQEGAALRTILASILDDLEKNCQEASRVATGQPELVRGRFLARLEALRSDDAELPEERIVQEAAVFAAKADVREELDRLAAHIEAGRDLLEQKGAKGRKLDFLSQELNREANTLCSKSASLELTNVGLALKAGIDQFREQIQNVE